ncbi:hypothetical protein OC844_002034 [Tilletia horrida]|nr:hypothetical protein OC844_002034 [Tilletia horrida]
MKLRLTTDAGDLFLRPGMEDTEPSLLTIHIHLDTGNRPPPKIERLTIAVNSHETLAFPSGRYEQTELFDWKQDVKDAAGLQLQPNTIYTFRAVFRVPNETSEYHRSMYGRRYQKATVKLTAPGFLKSKTWMNEKNLFFVHHPVSDDAFSYSRSETAVADGLGVVLTKASSAHLNVGGYLRVWLELPAPSPDVEVRHFEVSLLQSFTLRSRSDLNVEEVCPVQRLPFLTVQGNELDIGHWIARIPDDSTAKPSSHTVLSRGIIITHAFELAITYAYKSAISSSSSSSKDSTRVLRLRWPINLPSCALRYHSLRLPEYSKSDAAPVPDKERDEFESPNEHTSIEHCVCGQPLKELLAIEGELDAAPPDKAPDMSSSLILDEARFKFEDGTRTPKTPS